MHNPVSSNCPPFPQAAWACLTWVFLSTAGAQPSKPIHWAAVGNSITEWSGYTDKLQALLGPAFQVENDGVAGCTLLKRGDLPYWTKGKLAQALAFNPDLVSIKLGTNDSKDRNWKYKADFLNDARALADTLSQSAKKPKVMLCTPVPAFAALDGISETVILNEIIPMLKQVGQEKKLGVIDMHTPLLNRKDLFTKDGIHPDTDKSGPDSIAAFLFRHYRENAIRLACIGNSITDNNHDANAYPIKFNMLLGRDYLVLNAGHAGKTLLRKGDAPYEKSEWFKKVFEFKPNVITIKLGTNDSKVQNWDTHKDEFVGDLRWLLDTLSTLSTHPRIVLCTPIPAWKDANGQDPLGIRGDIIKNEIIPKIAQVAAERSLTLLDLYTPFLPYSKLTLDGVHPNAEGQDTLAHILYRAFKAAPTTGVFSAKYGKIPQKLANSSVYPKSTLPFWQGHAINGRQLMKAH